MEVVASCRCYGEGCDTTIRCRNRTSCTADSLKTVPLLDMPSVSELLYLVCRTRNVICARNKRIFKVSGAGGLTVLDNERASERVLFVLKENLRGAWPKLAACCWENKKQNNINSERTGAPKLSRTGHKQPRQIRTNG